METIEVELRSFVSESEFLRLVGFFEKNAKFTGDDEQETHYFDGGEDLRIQKNLNFSKVWLKKGALHDTCREEIEIHTGRENFESLSKLFFALGKKVRIKWFRKRKTFEWKGVTVCLDFTRGYGRIIELEKLCPPGEEKQALEELEKRMSELGIRATPREEFDRKFREYEKNWEKLTA
jgi:predicted adenylyl cyclase CyaB